MKANKRAFGAAADDDGVSPVIAVILMVAITVVLAATVYVWTSGFADSEAGPESASAAVRNFDADGNGANDWMRVTLTRGENAPYDASVVQATLVSGTTVLTFANSTTDDNVMCDTPVSASQLCSATFGDGADASWDIGETIFIPCQAIGRHTLTVSIRESTVLDTTVDCDEAAD